LVNELTLPEKACIDHITDGQRADSVCHPPGGWRGDDDPCGHARRRWGGAVFAMLPISFDRGFCAKVGSCAKPLCTHLMLFES
jgi:hypothetical protein